MADTLTGFGPFVKVYLIANGGRASEVGTALTVGTVAAAPGQVPAGALLDAVPLKRRIVASRQAPVPA